MVYHVWRDTILRMMNTALITGASAGIGAEYARQLAEQGYDLIITARRQERLEALANTLRSKHAVDVEVVAADLADIDQQHQLADLIRNRKIDLLINNAGFGTEQNPLAEADVQRQLDMLNVHMIATYLLSQAVLPQMIERGEGAIINVSSIAGFFHSGGSINYSATKGYITQFSQGLASEVRKHGINVQALCPGFTHTEFHDTPELKPTFNKKNIPDVLWMTSEQVVRISLNKLNSGTVVLIPGRRNRMIVKSSQIGLGTIVRRIGRKLTGR